MTISVKIFCITIIGTYLGHMILWMLDVYIMHNFDVTLQIINSFCYILTIRALISNMSILTLLIFNNCFMYNSAMSLEIVYSCRFIRAIGTGVRVNHCL